MDLTMHFTTKQLIISHSENNILGQKKSVKKLLAKV